MNKIKQFYQNHFGVSIIATAALITLLIGTAFAAITLGITFSHEKLYLKELCFHNKCISNWLEFNSSTFKILGATGTLIAGLVTIGGILVAIASYQNSVKTSDFTNHLSHITIFTTYIHNEIDKRSRLAKSEIDTLKWYNYIYTSAETGIFEISENYKTLIQQIDSQIIESNQIYSEANPEIFSYKKHQTKTIEIMANIGISMHRLPRLDFYEAEGQILDLISTVNQSFCRRVAWEKFKERSYK